MRSFWKNLSPAGRIALILGIAVGAATLVLAARKDLRGRDPGSIRGDPEVWDRIARFPGGAAAYLIGGRRHQRSAAGTPR
jgi:hypothetical protein